VYFESGNDGSNVTHFLLDSLALEATICP
jgi:hypothetical protein